jgi:hypothetical protein
MKMIDATDLSMTSAQKLVGREELMNNFINQHRAMLMIASIGCKARLNCQLIHESPRSQFAFSPQFFSH